MTGLRARDVVPIGWLTGVWVLLWGNLSVANVLAGLVLGVLVLRVFPLPALVVGVGPRPLRLARLVLRFLWDVVVASIQVAWVAVRPRPVNRSSVVVIQLRTRDELFQTIVAEMSSLVPGTVVVDLDGARGRLALHVLAADSPALVEAARADALALEDRVLAALAANAPSTPGPAEGGGR